MDGLNAPWQKTLGQAFAISLGLLALPDLLIMIFSAKDRRVVRFAGIWGPLSIAVYAVCVFSLGILAYGAVSADQLAPFMKNPDGLVPFLAKTIPAGFDSIILLAAISAAMSTMSAIVLVTTTSLTSDILRYLRPEISDKGILLLTRVVGVAILLVAAVSAVNVPQQIVPLGIRQHGRDRLLRLCAAVLRPLLAEGDFHGLHRQPSGVLPFCGGLVLLRQPTHPSRLHRPHLRHGGLRGRKFGDGRRYKSA